MKIKVLLCILVALVLSACSGGSNDDADAVDTEIIPAIVDSSNERLITTPFNGFMLSELRTQREGRADSFQSYRYDSDGRTITGFNATGGSPSFDDAEASRIIELNSVGLPQTITRFTGGEVVLVDNHFYDSAGRLESRRFDSPITNAQPQPNNYLYHSDGQLAAEITVDAETGIEQSRTDYTYSSNGALFSSSSRLFGIASFTEFASDPFNRISGWTEINSLSDAVTTATYSYDENNNITTIEIVDSTGIFSRTLNFTYIETTDPVYNSIWFDYLYSPRFD